MYIYERKTGISESYQVEIQDILNKFASDGWDVFYYKESIDKKHNDRYVIIFRKEISNLEKYDKK